MDSPILKQLLRGMQTNKTPGRALYLQLADALLALIRKGAIAAGQQLPPSRALAEALQLHRITVTRAYQELQAQGWLESHVGRGTFVPLHMPEQQPRRLAAPPKSSGRETAGFSVPERAYFDISATVIDTRLHLDDGYPDPELAPIRELYRAYRSQLQRSKLYQKFGSYGLPVGTDYYRTEIARYLQETRAVRASPANILSIRGMVMGLNLVCNGLIEKGDVVAAGVPGWNRAERNFIHAGAKLEGIPVDAYGLDTDALKKLCRRKRVRMIYVTPHHHYPTTVPLRLDRRLALLQLAREYGFIIFEDDYDYDFHYGLRPLLPLASADEEGMVIYCGSFSKTFSPTFRMGYLVAAQNVVAHLGRVRVLLDRQGDHILDNAMAQLLHEGTIQRNLRKTLAVYRERRDLFCGLLRSELGDAVDFEVPEGGLTVWTRFAQHIDLEQLAKAARRRELHISDGQAHVYPGFDAHAIRLGFASSTAPELEESVAILRSLVRK
jgi:GntR family transcriptional regulator/MocR family aminotransferase